jgi:hypothetical protein
VFALLIWRNGVSGRALVMGLKLEGNQVLVEVK